MRPSSLGDVIHALTLVADVRKHRPELEVDWVVETGFVPLVAMHPGVRRAIPVSFRRWRHHLFSSTTWAEFVRFKRDLQRDPYVAVLDLQEQLKGALIASLARGVRHGPDRASIREPIATLAHDRHHAVDSNQHLIDRCRQLAAAALGYRVEGPPVFGIVPPRLDAQTIPGKPYVVLVHGTSRADKLWPESDWRTVIAALAAMGLGVVLPWGSDAELARGERMARGFPGVLVPPPPRFSLPVLAAVLAQAKLVVGVDTGLLHLAAALGVPTISLFVATDPALCGVASAGPHARDLGGLGAAPSADIVLRAIGPLVGR